MNILNAVHDRQIGKRISYCDLISTFKCPESSLIKSIASQLDEKFNKVHENWL